MISVQEIPRPGLTKRRIGQQRLEHGLLQKQLKKLSKDNSDLKKLLAAAEGKEVPDSAEDLAKLTEKFRKSISHAISAQMVYRKQANKSRLSASFPNMTLVQVSLWSAS